MTLGRRWRRLLVLVLAASAAACGRAGPAVPAVSPDAQSIVTVTRVDLGRASGTSIAPVPDYVVTDAGVVAVDVGEGRPAEFTIRGLSSGQVADLRRRLRSAGLTRRPQRDGPQQEGRGIEFDVRIDAGDHVVVRRPNDALSATERGILSSLRSWSADGPKLAAAPGGAAVVAVAGRPGSAPPWPVPSRPLVTAECTELRGVDGRRVLAAVPEQGWRADGFGDASFEQHGTRFDVLVRPIVLAEKVCPAVPAG